MRSAVWALALSVVVPLAGCFNEEVPSGVLITCKGNEDCPAGQVCRASIARCVPADDQDLTAPALLGAAQIAPAIARAGVLLQVQFVVSEELETDPVVHAGTQPLAVVEEGTNRAALSYLYAYRVAGSEPEGSPVPVTIDLMDVAGNAAAGLAGGSALYDFTPPVLVATSGVTPAAAKEGATLVVSFSLSEVLGAEPIVGMVAPSGLGAPRTWTLAGKDEAGRYTSNYGVQGDEEEGDWQVLATVVDVAGNASAPLALGSSRFDFQVPAVASTVVDPQSGLARPGQVVTVTVTLTEPSASAPTLVGLDGAKALPLDLVRFAGEVLVFQHAVAPGDDGSYALWLEGVEDAAGNALGRQQVATVVLDGTAPDLLDYQQTAGALGGKDTFVVEFTPTEPLGEEPLVKLGQKALAREGTSTAPYRYSLALAGTALLGDYDVQVALVDLAGNGAVVSPGVAHVDAVPPTLIDASFSPPVARLGITAYLTVTASERLGPHPVLGWDAATGDPGFDWATYSGQAHTFALPISTSVASGVYTLAQVTLEDESGNVATVDAHSVGLVVFEVDNQPPVVSGLTVNGPRFSAQAGFDQVAVDFQVSKVLSQPGGLVVEVGANAATCAQLAGAWHCTYRVRGTEGEGPALIKVTATDAAGNSGFDSASVIFDFTAPAIVSSSASPALARLGDEIAYSLAASEPLVGPPTLAVGGPAGLSLTLAAGTQYVFRHTVTAGDADGAYTVAVDMEDLAGNKASALPAAGFALDATVPTITGLVAERERYSAVPGFDQVVVAVELSEPLPAGALEVLVGAMPATCTPSSGQGFSCTYQVLGTERQGATLIKALATDAAGNADFESTSVEFDFTAPQVVAGSESLQLDPPAGSALTKVRKATAGSTARISFNVSEALGADPVVGVPAPGSLAFALLDRAGSFYRYGHTLAAPLPADGTYALEATLVDLVGNSRKAALAPALAIDGTNPAAPRTDLPDAVVYTRIPWGADQTGGAPQMRLEGAAGATEGSGTLLVYSAATEPKAEIGRTEARADGGFDAFQLIPADRPQVYVAFADEAGNLSPLALVLDGEWVATFGGKVAGSAEANPHVLIAHQRMPDALLPAGLLGSTSSELDGAPVALRDAATATVLGAGGQWALKGTAPTPGPRTLHSMVYDSARGRMVVFGGFYANTQPEGVWEWDGLQWQQAMPSYGPSPRYRLAMAYDALRDRTVVFGGGPVPKNDTWTWDGVRWQRAQPLLSPPARYWHTLAFDSRRGRTVLFGGDVAADTWEWDGTRWLERRLAHYPSSRRAGAMAYDAARGQVVLYGGEYSTDDTWLYDGDDWKLASPAHRPPVIQYEAAMAYDSARARIVLFDGDGAWEWDGTDWSSHAAVPAPPPRSNAAMAFDPILGETILYGGDGACAFTFGACDDVWAWNGTRWREITPRPAPPARMYFPFVYDSRREKAVLFSGHGLMGSQADTWAWNGANWLQETPTVSPPVLDYASGAYDEARGEFVVRGNFDATWLYDGLAWRSVSDPAGPPALYYSAIAYDEARQQVVQFGGSSGACPMCTKTWTWNGTGWTERAPAHSPPARMHHALGYDRSRQRVVLYGGSSGSYPDYTFYQDTWEWDGNDWTLVPTTHLPKNGVNHGHSLAFDALRGRLVLLTTDWMAGHQLWEWGGTDWLPSTLKPQLEQFDQRMVYDAARARLVAFGTQTNNTTTLFDLGAGARPGAWARFSLAAAALPATTVAKALESSFAARGTSTGSAGPLDGVELLGWDRGRWTHLADDGASPGKVEWSLASIDDLEGLTRDEGLDFAVVPLGSNGTGAASVTLDYAEVRLKYRLRRAGSLQAVVTFAATGAPAPGAVLETSPFVALATTGADGAALLPGMPEGACRVAAWLPSYAVAAADVTVVAGQATQVSLALVELGGFDLVVQGANGVAGGWALLHGVDNGRGLDASGQLAYTHLAAGTYTLDVMVPGYAKASLQVTVVDGQTGTVTVVLTPAVEICDNGVDDDNQNGADCQDPACWSLGGCPENCDTWDDEDGDGLGQCDDPDCYGKGPCTTESICFGGQDEDLDGQTDCADSDCTCSYDCMGEWNCFDGTDDDGDGMTDCGDPDCQCMGYCG